MTLYDFDAVTLDGRTLSLAEHRGRVVLIVNTASQCGFTPQLAGLEALWRRFQPRGFTVLGFPCNQFGHQEPGSAEEIQAFCGTRYDVTFPLMAKVEVNGASAPPLYRWLTAQAPGLLGTEWIKWNFTKFLVGKEGQVLGRYAPSHAPDKLSDDIERALVA